MDADVFREHSVTALLESWQRADGAEAGAVRESYFSRLRIGAHPGLCSSYLPSVTKQLSAAHPGLVVELVEADAAHLARMVADGGVDLALRPLLPRPPESAQQPRVTWCHRVIWREEVVAVLSDDDPLAGRDSLTIGDLLARALIGTPAGAAEEGGGFDLRAALGQAAAQAESVYLADQPRALVSLVRFGFGIGVIGRSALVNVDTSGVVIRGIDSPTAFHDMAVFWTEQRAQDAGIAAFLDAQLHSPLPAACMPPTHDRPRG